MFTNGKYILSDKTPVPEHDLMVWARWMEEADRQVASDVFGHVQVSTIFLGLDYQFGDGLPILFETMVFGGELDDCQWRYATWEDALAGHAKAVQLVQAAFDRRRRKQAVIGAAAFVLLLIAALAVRFLLR
jgi:hypothetical protein